MNTNKTKLWHSVIAESYINEETHPFFSKNAEFDGILEIPKIKKPEKIIIPKKIIPFSRAIYCCDDYILSQSLIGFFEDDKYFKDFLIHPKKYFSLFKKAIGVIAPDCSLYFDDPLSINMMAVYMKNAIAHYLQENGFYVLANPRWGTEKTYTTCVLPEKIAFLGCPKNSVLCIGTYGAVKSKDEKFHFKNGLKEMLAELTPKTVLIFGAKPKEIFAEFENQTKFIQFDSWTKSVHNNKKIIIDNQKDYCKIHT